jgi:hypothetical protein
MRPAAEKTTANCRERVQVATMSEEPDVFVPDALGGRHDHALATRNRSLRHSFRIKGIDRLLSPGAYEVVTDEEMIQGLSFPCFRRVATMIMVPDAPPRHSSMEMISSCGCYSTKVGGTFVSGPMIPRPTACAGFPK